MLNYGKQLLFPVSEDANKHFDVIAYNVVDVEIRENCKWFLIIAGYNYSKRQVRHRILCYCEKGLKNRNWELTIGEFKESYAK